MADNSFGDMLVPGESVVAQLAGEGRSVERGQGVERTWWHVALTQHRVLLIRMHQPPRTGAWHVVARLATPRSNARLSHFPRTKADTARFTVEGFGEPVVFVNVDQPGLVQQVAAFTRAWGGPVAGPGVPSGEDEGYSAPRADEQKLLYTVAGVMAVGFALCCCGTFGVAMLRMIWMWVSA